MAYIKKSYAYKTNAQGHRSQRVFSGHIKSQTAINHGYDSVTLSIFDASGKGRGEDRFFKAPFADMHGFN